jgi:hypothetical protein
MIHRISIFSNPRIIIPFLTITVLFAGGILLGIYLNVTAAVIVLLISGFVLYGVIKVFVPALKCHVETTDSKIVFATGYGAEESFLYDDVDFAGLVKSVRKKKYLFIYTDNDELSANGETGTYRAIPNEFNNFEQLVSTVGEHLTIGAYEHDGTMPANEFIENLCKNRNTLSEQG